MAMLALLYQYWQKLYATTLFQYPSIVPPCLVLVLLIIFLLFTRSSRPLKTNVLPPSPPKLPIIGNLHQLGTHPHRTLKALSDEYGPVMLLRLGRAPTLVVSSEEMAREMVKNHDVVFSSRPQTTAGHVLLYGNKDVAFSPYGEYWRQVRKICVLELLSARRVQQFQFVREEEAALLVDRIRRDVDGSVNLSDMLVETSKRIICRCTLGQAFDHREGKGDGRLEVDVGGLLRGVMILLMEFSVGDLFPSLRWLDVLRGFIGRLKATFGELDRFFEMVIEERKRTRESKGADQSETKDFLDILLQLQQDGTLGFDLTRDNLKAILLDMFLGGTDTTSGALEWTMAELVRNPRAMRKAQEEVRRVVGKTKKIEMSDVNKMDYLKCVLKETLRLHPLAPLLAPRETTEGVDLGGYHIPAKTRVLVNSWAIQRQPGLWDGPDEFLPERFENNSIDYEGQDFQYIPFGVGRRSCPALKFGVTNIGYIVANLLYWFDWKLSGDDGPPEDLDMSEVYGLTVHKKVPLHLIPKLYFP